MVHDTDKRYIVSVRVCGQEFAVPGSVKRPCMKCGELVWISPAMKDEKMGSQKRGN